MKQGRNILAVALSAFLLAGCFLNDDVGTNQQGVIVDGGSIKQCVPPGVYSDTSFYADLIEVSMSTLTINVEDPEVATRDNQLVGMTVVVQARRNSDCDSLRNLLTNWPNLLADDGLVQIVQSTTNEAMKNGTREFTLTALLDDRNGLATKIKDALEEDAAAYSTSIVNVLISNVDLADEYAAELQKKALLTAQTETELRRQDLIKQQSSNDQLQQQQQTLILEAQLKAEKAKTEVEVEIAAREGKKIEATNNIYLINTAAYDLERLRLLKDVIGDRQVIYFVPEGTDLTLFLNNLSGQNTQVVPVEPEQPR